MVPGFAIRLLHGGAATTVPFEVAFQPDLRLTISDLGIAIELETDRLVPVEKRNGIWTPILSPTGGPTPLTLTMPGLTVVADFEGNLDISGDAGVDSGWLRLATLDWSST